MRKTPPDGQRVQGISDTAWLSEADARIRTVDPFITSWTPLGTHGHWRARLSAIRRSHDAAFPRLSPALFTKTHQCGAARPSPNTKTRAHVGDVNRGGRAPWLRHKFVGLANRDVATARGPGWPGLARVRQARYAAVSAVASSGTGSWVDFGSSMIAAMIAATAAIAAST